MAMRLHARETQVQEIRARLRQVITEVIYDEAADLTSWEAVQVVSSVMGDVLGGLAKYAIREERHGDADRPGGLE